MTARFHGHRAASTVALLAALSTVALTLSGCGRSAGSAAGGKIRVVASTNVWGSVVQAVGGDAIELRSIISHPSADPHSYESTPADAAAVKDADLVVFNGGGYDPFIPKILSSAGPKRTVQAVTLLDGKDQNEHVWYDLPVVERVADQLAAQLGAIKPDHRDTVNRNAEAFHAKVDALDVSVHEIGNAHGGGKVLATEPIAHYLLEDAKLTDVAPEKFVHAIETQADPPADSIAQVRQLINTRAVAVLVHNPQTESPVTKRVKTDAERARVPVVEMTETLPEGKDYPQWMSDQVDKLRAALEQR
jgi:zinc/manganese transport system substrate-binding protein